MPLWAGWAGRRRGLSGTLRAGFGNYAASLARASVLKIKRVPGGDPALELRDGFAAQVRRAIREPEASLGIGFLLGKKSELPQQLLEALKIAGLTHIIVASGYNLTILVRLARRLFAKVSKFLAMFASVGLIGGFMAVIGESGAVLGAIYNDADPTPASNAELHVLQYRNGTRIEHDRSTGDVRVTTSGKVLVQASEVTLDAPQTTTTGNLLVQGSLTYQGGMTGSGGKGAAAQINGNIRITGDVEAGGNIDAGGEITGTKVNER